ncbi:MAG: AIM24 family protein, partial [Clostridia bacterium]|nr:AIM24 family protein [Clostridia bacterium]
MQYQITGEPMPVVICTRANGESIICEGGAMSWMSPNMEMQTSAG